MVEEFESVAFGLSPGDTSGIFRSSFGYHIAKLYERRSAGIASLNQVREDIERALWEERKQEVVRSFVNQLRLKADIRNQLAESK